MLQAGLAMAQRRHHATLRTAAPKSTPMKLTPAQHLAFNTDGYLFFPAIFKPEQMPPLLDAVPALYARREARGV